ncbi:VCBS repeat protein [Streptomyces sp. PanSC19]|uniref:FG-GAP repeat domain-containing protein n=1 Tax=Streptomyces sp. PanSC19 TaxID=1520455 RepID=UPI000FADA95A|nr:VCBS repeat-containing protein [Streptomyces sp. PanSC19]ROQ23521.1 VCBS repeat protein [Streptomyces sp. PanSC19]
MQLRTNRSRLATAVTAVLAVTALGFGTPAAAPAAFAATSAPSGQVGAALPVFPEGADLAGAGTSGFLSYSYDRAGTKTVLWTPFDGGMSTRLKVPENGGSIVAGSDVVVIGDADRTDEMSKLTLRNMADPSAPAVDIDLGALSGTYLAVASPTSVLAQIRKDDGTSGLHVVTKTGTTTTSREIAGLPEGATDFAGSTVHDGSVLVGYVTGPEDERTYGRALIDVAAGTVSATYSAVPSWYGSAGLVFSASHVAWPDQTDSAGLYLSSVDRRTGEQRRTLLGDLYGEWSYVLVGDWLVYGEPWTPVRAVSLTSGETRDLGITASAWASSADNTALLQGNPVSDEGLFRVAAGQDGTPTVTKVAEPGKPVIPLEIDEVHVPDVANLDKSHGRVTLGWTVSRADAYVDVTLTHIATGKEFAKRLTAPTSGTEFSFDWEAVFEEATPDEISFVDAPNGKYAVEAEATLLDGTGEPVHQGWFMNITRTYNPHDFDDNGSTDVLARDASGVLWRDDLRDRPVNGQVKSAQRAKIGSGWGVYKQIEAVGNVGGAAPGDLIAVDGSGVQWLYLGKGDGTFAPRVKVGTGWQIYNKIAGGSDLDGDGRPDLVATDGAGALWFYKGTGSYAKPYAPRVSLGGNWQGYNQLTAVGNIAGTAAGDMVARDTSGVLWLYQGNGTGGFAPRVKVGGGWGAFSQLVGAGDLDNDGRPDLIAYGTSGEYGAYVYRSTGNAAAPFSRRTTSLYKYQGRSYNHVA